MEQTIKKLKRIGRSALAIMIMLMLVITSLPGGIFSIAENADAIEFTGISGSLESKKLLQYDMKSAKYMQIYWVNYKEKELLKDGSCTEANSPFHIYHINTGKAVDPLVFCMEHGVVQRNTTNMGARVYKTSEMWTAYENSNKKYAMENIKKVLFYGPVNKTKASELFDLGFGESNFYGQNGSRSDYDISAWVAATQCLVWECQQDFRDENFNRQANGLYYQTTYQGAKTTPIAANHYTRHIAGTPAIDIYNFMASEIKKNNRFDSNVASRNENNPQEILIKDDETFPITKELKGTTNGSELEVIDENDKVVKGISITFNKEDRKYILTVNDESLIGKTLMVRHKGPAAQRAEKYTKGTNKRYYEPVVWGYSTNGGASHTQGFVSGLDDPVRGYFKLTKNPPNIRLGTCSPLDVDVFPVINMPIEKVDANPGFDGDVHTPMGDAKLDAVATLERQIGGGAWETIKTHQFDDYGNQIVFSDQPFKSASDLTPYMTESGSLTYCGHYDDEGNQLHPDGEKAPTRRVWNVTVNYRITITRPDGRYVDPDQYGGVREYSINYSANTRDTCTMWCEGDPWTPVSYTIGYGATRGDGGRYTLTGTSEADGGTIGAEQVLDCDLETDVEDLMRGRVHLIKSNEKENPFKDSAMGGSDSNMSKASKWTVRLKSKGFENSEYIHLKSATPTKLADGTNVYTVSRDEGAAVCDEQSPLVVGTNGAILIEDLPYGEYIITEVEADDPMYVLEQFTVVVSEHNGSGAEQRIPFGNQGDVPLTGKWNGYNKTGTNGTGGKGGTGDYYNNLYQVNLRDKIKSNQIQLQKVDSETGKIVRMEGTKVFIRYKGNPDYTDEENQKRYGPTGTVAKNIYNRFLPNAEGINSKSTNYTFELDENGCFDIEYELPYGKYEIYEWLLPEGYFVGEYDETGTAGNHNFGFISEGQFTVDAALHGFNGVVPSYAIKDEAGNRVEYKDKSEYSFENLTKMVTNRYTFTVTKQDMHIDGNYSELVTYDGNLRTDADPTYEKSDYPFTKYYKVAAVINNAAKGKIAIEKEGEELSGFVKEVKDGRTIFTPIYEMGAKLKDAVFGIFAAEDINLNDGSEGPAIYDSKTGELITIPKTKSSHFSSAVESVKAFFGKLLNPKEYSASNYETGEYSHESGAELWYMLERQVSEGNIKRTIYITPEQKDTTYSYSYEAEDDMFNYRWDVQVILRNQAGGANVTDVKVTKVTSAKDGYVTDIPLTQMTGSVGAAVLDPLDSYMNLEPGADPNLVSALDAYTHTYTYEADGSIGLDFSGTDTDFSNIGVRRYAVKEYDYYLLTAADLKKEERKVGERQVIDMPGNDANGDGDFDDPEDTPPTYRTEDIKETRTIFEWNNEGWELVGNPAAGDRAVLREKDAGEEASYKAAVTGYYAGTDAANLAEEEKAGTVKYTSLTSGAIKYEFIQSDFMGEQIKGYEVPQGFTETAFTGNPKTEPRYVIAANAAGDAYKVLLSDGITWQDCTIAGNFAKAAVQVYEVKYTQVAGDPDGFTLNWDGFAIGSNVDVDTNIATTIITKHTAAVGNEVIDVGAGYESQNAGDTITFNTIPITAPVYFAWKDGVKADMYYKGGVAYATIALPQSAVDYLYEHVVPTLSFNFTDVDGKDGCINLDWYSKLTPENPQAKFSVIDGLPEGCTVTATRTDSTQIGVEPTYFIQIVTNQKEDKPLRLTFADGYVMDVYCAEAASGNGVGVIDLHNVYKTTRYTKGELVETLTTDDEGKAESKLLPLGKYIVRELNAPEGYVTSDKENEVVLKYKDQFTPLVWQDVRESNPYMSVEIDLSKVFETAYKSGQYVASGGATFGLYAGEELNTGKKDTTNIKGKIPAGSLLDVIVVDATGKARSNIKLPYGTYYIKELSTLDTHEMDAKPYYFKISDDGASAPCEFDYGTDGISGKVVMEKYGEATITVKTEERYPMPNITVNGRQYLQSQDYIQEGLTIKASDDKTTVKVTAKDNTPVSLTLPNGRVLKVTVKGNTYEYTIDGVTKAYTPEVSFTGYYAAYEKAFEAQKPTGDEPQPIVDSITLKAAGANASTVRADVTHTPKEDKTGYTHSAVISVTGADGAATVTGDIIRTVKGKDTTEAISPDGTISLAAGESIAAFDVNGAQIGVYLDETGKIKESVAGTLKKAVTDENRPKTTLNGVDVSGDMEYVKSVSLARQDRAAETVQVKVNTIDNLNSGDIKNDHKDVPIEPTTPDSDTTGKIVITKTDSVTGKPLAGAEFELWKSKREGIGDTAKMVPDVLLETKTSDADGKVVYDNLTLGTYFYREISAPKDYILDSTYRQADVYTDFAVQVTVPNQPEGSTLIISKVSPSGKPLAGAVFEIWSAKKVKGEYVKDKIITKATSDANGEIAISGLKTGAYYYHEIKAPDGYVTNGKYHLFTVTTNGGFITKKVVNKKVGTLEVFTQFLPGIDDPAGVSMMLKGSDPDNPKTGDTSNLAWWLLIAILAGGALSLLMLRKKNN